MVGARPGVYLESLQEELRLYGLDQARFLPETGEIYDFYRLADIFVCTSFEESVPARAARVRGVPAPDHHHQRQRDPRDAQPG